MNTTRKMLQINIVEAIVIIVFVTLIQWVSFQFARPAHAAGYKIDYETILIHFEADTSLQERDRVIRQVDGTLVKWFAPLYVAEVQVERVSRKEFTTHQVRAAASSSVIELVEHDAIIQGTYIPDDPDLEDEDKSYAPQTISAMHGWDITLGSPDVIIAILDTGINISHPEFAGRLVQGYDFVNDDNDPTDDHGHGTHVAGIVAATANNGLGSAGVCPKCSIMPIKVLNENNSGKWTYVADGINYAADNGAKVINLSLGSTALNHLVEKAIIDAQNKNVLVIAAAGNAATDRTFYPAAFDNVLAVNATDQNDRRWSLSNFGDYIDVSAPGNAIYSTAYDLNNSYGGYTFMNGTSMAAPHVAGLAGLLFSQDRTLSNADVAQRIMESADDLGDSGRDDQYGHGRINVCSALLIGHQRTEEGLCGDPRGADPAPTPHVVYLPLIKK